ncbi:sensor histidine kinase [Chryseobacterium sp. MDT2-18]|uniref:sensor histidine kinase n=1 Tax=Chryseobacterium sp. MDT2-18 TaxID=1259136 RepID=UPI0027859E0A|nr:histidine kinase [Chryseobacterium sp. MDT2-18]MDQ0476629.1 sensor histidine kinase YesM [Chryseobacterium sp. MDT2-18]
MSQVFNTIIERDTYGSILYAVLGGLLLLSIYHLVLFFQNRDKSYLLYSFYTFFSFLAYIPVAEGGFLFDLSKYFNLDFRSKQFFTIIFNCLYFLFFVQFLRVKKRSKKWHNIIVYPVFILITIATVTFLILKSGISDFYFDSFKGIFPYLIAFHTIISFYILTKVKNKLKYYIIFGGIMLFICSILGERSVREFPFLNLTVRMGDFIYFAGLVVENIAFSFALGHRQRMNYHEKVAYNRNLISEMKKNEELKDKINLQHQKRLLAENDRIKYQQEISALKLSILQNQMNPHFIFNALNSIKYYILEHDTENAVNYLTKFSQIIRTILVSSTVKEFTLDQELHTIKVYVDIENLRFTKKIDFNIVIDEQINSEKIKLPPMVLQTFIENAILHGVATLDHKKITINVLRKNQQLEIRISDNGVGRKEAAKNRSRRNNSSKSLGTKIADEMLKNYFGPESYKIKYYDLHKNDQPTGTMVVLEIPIP